MLRNRGLHATLRQLFDVKCDGLSRNQKNLNRGVAETRRRQDEERRVLFKALEELTYGYLTEGHQRPS